MPPDDRSQGTPRDQRSPGGPSVRSVDRAVTLLELVAASGQARVTDLAAEIGVHKSTVSRLLTTLEARGLLQQEEERGTYRLGYGIVELAGAMTDGADLVAISRPVAEALAVEVGETVNVVVRDGTDSVCVDQVIGTSSLTSVNWVGARTPLHATASGKALLAGLDDASVLGLLPADLAAPTPHTITDPSALLNTLRTVAERGWADAVDEQEEGLTSVAAPINAPGGEVVGALAVSGPSFRLASGWLDEVGSATARAAARISRRARFLRRP